MNSLKNLLVITVLLIVGYAVYTTINSQPGPTRPPEQADGWPTSVDVQMPGGNDAKSAPPKNPFAARGNDGAERVPVRDADSFNSSRNNVNSAATARPPVGPSDRTMPPFSASDSRPAPPARDAGLRPDGSTRPSDSAVDAPGVAMTSDLPPHSPAPAGPAAGASRPKKAENLSAESSGLRTSFVQMMEEAHRLLGNGQLAEVQLVLSKLYTDPDPPLTTEESQRLIELLDQLTGTVIYSRQHLLEQPYVVKLDDTLQQVAQSYNVPWQLLAKINGVRQPDRLQAGTQLKMVRGPFQVVVFLGRYELVLMLGDRYAGRFPIGIGRDNPQLEGSYTLRKKVVDPPYIAADCRFEPGDPNNPLGKFWLELDDRLAIHGTNDAKNLRRSEGRGTICLGPRDIEDLCDILTASDESPLASKVTIRR